MATVMVREELVRRALVFVDQTRQEKPECSLDVLMDEAGARFNLSPADSAALYRLFQEAAQRNA